MLEVSKAIIPNKPVISSSLTHAILVSVSALVVQQENV